MDYEVGQQPFCLWNKRCCLPGLVNGSGFSVDNSFEIVKVSLVFNQDLMNGQFTMTSIVLVTRTLSFSLSLTVQKISSPAGMASVLTLMIG